VPLQDALCDPTIPISARLPPVRPSDTGAAPSPSKRRQRY
jgi:hypothetical protein